MNIKKAFFAGVLGAVVMTAIMLMARSMGMTEMNLEMALGSMMLQTVSPTSWAVGLVIHLMIGGVLALVYAAGFEYITHQAGWLTGIGFAVVHVMIAGIFMGMMGMIHPLMVASRPVPAGHLLAPGFFAMNFGMMTTAAVVMLHLIYGAIVGSIYSPVVHGRHVEAVA